MSTPTILVAQGKDSSMVMTDSQKTIMLPGSGKPGVVLSRYPLLLTASELSAQEERQDKGRIENGHALVFEQNPAHIVVRTGPSSDMLSYLIQGIRNPALSFRTGATVKILFVNADDDMPHDLRCGESTSPFPVRPDTSNSIGTPRLSPIHDDRYSAEEVDIRFTDTGIFSYYCSVTGHAAGGMWGLVVVGSNSKILSRLSTIATDRNDTSQEMSKAMQRNQKSDSSAFQNGKMKMSGGDSTTGSMIQEWSGTSWVPASSPIYASMSNIGDWGLMVHGSIMPRYDHQGGPRGAEKFDAPNWFMGMLTHDIGSAGRLTFRGMFSLDPLTEGKGYPMLFQTGDTWQGKALPDYKDPHNLFDELSVAYSYRFAPSISALIYLGYPGEPALGPPVFMHRTSAMSNPDAPIGHDWMDGTHITFGVATAGITVEHFKIEGSVFNGSSPSIHLYGIDKLQLNSYSGRLSFNPTDDIALQVSTGYMKNPGGDSIDVIRSTASAIYTKNNGVGSWWSTTLSWGENHELNLAREEAFLLESQYTIPNYTFFGRAEYVQKSDAELALSDNPTLLHNLSYTAIGLTRTLSEVAGIETQIGAQISYHFVPESLRVLYSEHPISYEIYFSLTPSLMN